VLGYKSFQFYFYNLDWEDYEFKEVRLKNTWSSPSIVILPVSYFTLQLKANFADWKAWKNILYGWRKHSRFYFSKMGGGILVFKYIEVVIRSSDMFIKLYIIIFLWYSLSNLDIVFFLVWKICIIDRRFFSIKVVAYKKKSLQLLLCLFFSVRTFALFDIWLSKQLLINFFF